MHIKEGKEGNKFAINTRLKKKDIPRCVPSPPINNNDNDNNIEIAHDI